MKSRRKEASFRRNSSFFLQKRYYLPLLSAILLAASLIPYHLLVTNFLFLIPLFFFIKRLDDWRDAMKGGLWFGVPLYLISAYWFYALIRISYFTILIYLAVVVYFSIFMTLFVLISYQFHRRWGIRFFLFAPFLWIILEHVRTFGPFKLTVDHLSNSMAIYPYLIQFIDLTGPYGLTFWLILSNALIFEAVHSFQASKRFFVYSVIVLLVILLPSVYSLHLWKSLKFEHDLKVSLIQPNIPLEKKLNREFASENMETIQSIVSQAVRQKPDILIWPETSFPFTVQHWIKRSPAPSLPEISALAQYSYTPMLVGAEYARIRTKEDYDIYNAALLMDSGGRILDFYGKVYLVPFVEGIPFKELLGVKRLGRKGFLSQLGGFTPGEKLTVFEFEKRKPQFMQPEQQKGQSEGKEKVKFGTLICYEGLYPELARKMRKGGANFLACITNDAWFGDTLFPRWHARILRMRAVENRISVVRCGNTGISGFCDPAGRMYQTTELFTKAIVSGLIATTNLDTFYSRYGDIILYLSYPIILLIAFAAVIRKRPHA
ncbi:MAG: apolipoprotein N-acyltransferase [Acidobacteriota bacterium]